MQALPSLTYNQQYDLYVLPCEDAIAGNVSLPDIGFTMNGTTYSLPESAWILTVSARGLMLCTCAELAAPRMFTMAEIYRLQSWGLMAGMLSCISASGGFKILAIAVRHHTELGRVMLCAGGCLQSIRPRLSDVPVRHHTRTAAHRSNCLGNAISEAIFYCLQPRSQHSSAYCCRNCPCCPWKHCFCCHYLRLASGPHVYFASFPANLVQVCWLLSLGSCQCSTTTRPWTA